MKIDFEKTPRFKFHQIQINRLIPQWAFAHQVSEDEIVRHIYQAHAWCDSNPKKAPQKNPVRFLWSYLRLAKKYGNLVATRRDTTYRDEPVEGDMTVDELIAIRKQNFPAYRG